MSYPQVRQRLSHFSLHITQDSELNDVFISVKDNGCGIEQSNITKIFNPFFTTKENFKGTGLGLSVSLGIAQSHGGRIVVQSELGQGSYLQFNHPSWAEG